MIQDLVIVVASTLFGAALLPSIFSRNKPSRWTSLVTGSGLAALTWVYLSLNLFFGAVVTGSTSFLWFVLFFQKVLLGR